MSAPTRDRELSHPAARAIHAVLAIVRAARWGIGARHVHDAQACCQEVFDLADAIPEDVAALYQDNETKEGQLADLREEGVRMAQYIVRLEEANTKHVITAGDLKTRLARAAENNEELYRLTSHAVGDATERHLIVSRNRALLDLEMPLPPVKPVAISTPTPYGAPRVAASH